ncbi:MAG: hypothetical protein RLY31_3199 [Bacteroidota bacterium]
MHELSIVLHIVDCAEEAARSASASRIDGIVLEIGALSGVELPALTFVWEEGVRGSLLEGAERTIVEVPGNGQCRACGHAFAMETLYDPCPACFLRPGCAPGPGAVDTVAEHLLAASQVQLQERNCGAGIIPTGQAGRGHAVAPDESGRAQQRSERPARRGGNRRRARDTS